MQNSQPAGSSSLSSSHGSRCAHAQRSIPTSRRLSPFPCRTSSEAAVRVKVGLVQRERLADPQPRAPQHHDDAAQSHTLGIVAGGAHDSDDLLDRRRIGRVPQPLVRGRDPLVEAGRGRGRSRPASAIQQRRGFHDVLLWTAIDDRAIVPPPRATTAGIAREARRREPQASPSAYAQSVVANAIVSSATSGRSKRSCAAALPGACICPMGAVWARPGRLLLLCLLPEEFVASGGR